MTVSLWGDLPKVVIHNDMYSYKETNEVPRLWKESKHPANVNVKLVSL